MGGDIVWIKIENEWSTNGTFEWVDVTNQATVVQSEIDTQMYDNLDGTYTYDYSVDLDGNITISVILYTKGGLYGKFHNSKIYRWILWWFSLV